MNKQKQKFFEKQYSVDNYFNKNFNSSIVELKNNYWNKAYKYQVYLYLKNKLNISEDFELERIHEYLDESLLSVKKADHLSNERNRISELIFEFCDDSQDTYIKFMKWVYGNVIKEDFYFQKTPTIRLHIPGQNFSYPKWHSDCFLGHSPKEMNFWFGLTNNKESGFWILDLQESNKWLKKYEYDLENFFDNASLEGERYSENVFDKAKEIKNISDHITIFDGRCIHTALNRSKKDPTTRISIDTRILLKKEYKWETIDQEPLYVGKGIKKAHFKPGGKYGYHEKSIMEILNE
jgi:hypothetical protein